MQGSIRDNAYSFEVLLRFSGVLGESCELLILTYASSGISQIHRLENTRSEFEKLACGHQLLREFLKALHYALRFGRSIGLSDDQSREQVSKPKAFRILPEARAKSSLE